VRLQATAGNAAVSRLLRPGATPAPPRERRAAPVAVQREGPEPVGAGPGVRSDGAELVPFKMEQELELDTRVPGIPIKLEKVGAKVEVKGKLAPPEQGEGEGEGGVKVGTSGSLGSKPEAGIKAELGTVAKGHLDALSQKLKYDAKLESAVKGGPGEIKAASSLTASVQDESFKGTPLENLKLEGELSLFEIDWKARTTKRPEVKVLAFSPKLTYETPPFEHPFTGIGQKGTLTIAGEVSLEFGPNWEQIVTWLIEEIGPEALAEVGVPLAIAAAGAALIYFGVRDMERRQELFMRVQGRARGIVQAGNIYAMVMAGQNPTPMGRAETDAITAARADLGKVASAKNIDEGVYAGLMQVPEWARPMQDRTGSAYVDQALNDFEGQVDKEIDDWHSEHWAQTFFSGTYAKDDRVQVMLIIARERQTGGTDTLG
jgi:hypothetical protein